MDYEQMAMDLLVALRGHRSQVQWSRWLGYRSNVAYSWEKGRRWPTAAETLRAASRAHVDVHQAMVDFAGRHPSWLDQHCMRCLAWMSAKSSCFMKGALSVTS